MKNQTCVVVPNWNGADMIVECLRSLQEQSEAHTIIVVDNGSVDESVAIIERQFPEVDLVTLPKNTGFTGGVNTGIRRAMELDAKYVALFNNDATAHPDWLKHLVAELDAYPAAGIATCSFMSADKAHFDSTGDMYSIWGLAFPRGRGEKASDKYNTATNIFGATGGASIFRMTMLQEIGVFDQDFFAYFEDIDLSFRAQLAGWKVRFVPESEAYHATGSTSGRLKGFGVYQSFKNRPLVIIKNVPLKLLPTVVPRFWIANISYALSATLRGKGWYVLKGSVMSWLLTPKKLVERQRIQKSRTVTIDYINSILLHDLPPDQTKLRKLRAIWRRFPKSARKANKV